MRAACQYYQMSAKLGDRDGMFSYGYTLMRESIGLVAGVPQAATLSQQERCIYELKTSEGIRYLRLASECGVIDAFFQLGRCYEQGIGVPRDEQSAFAQYKSAASKGHAEAALAAAHLLFGGFSSGMPSEAEVLQSIAFYRQAAELGNLSAINCLGLLCEQQRVSS